MWLSGGGAVMLKGQPLKELNQRGGSSNGGEMRMKCMCVQVIDMEDF